MAEGAGVKDDMKSKRAGTRKPSFPYSAVRHAVQVLMLIAFMLPPIVAGWGLFGTMAGGDDAVATPMALPFYGTLSSSSIFGVALVDPFAALQSIAAAKAVSPDLLLGVLVPMAVYGLIRGRVFCGWVCPVNLVLEAVDRLRIKLRVRVRERALPRHAKVYVALSILALSAVVSFPVFEALSPISFINKGIVVGSVVGGITIAAIIAAEMFWGHRVWCRSVCPLGGLYEALGKMGLLSVRIDHGECIRCGACKRACLCDPEILDDAVDGLEDRVSAGDCMLCGRCIEACPTRALRIGASFHGSGKPRG